MVNKHYITLLDIVLFYCSQSLINLLLCGRGVSNVWDNDRDISGLSKYSKYKTVQE